MNPPTAKIPWQRLILSLIGIAIVIFVWWWATKHLYVLPQHAIMAFTSITTNSLYVIGALVVFFVTGQVFYQWINQTASTVIQEAQGYFGEKQVRPKDIDDGEVQ